MSFFSISNSKGRYRNPHYGSGYYQRRGVMGALSEMLGSFGQSGGYQRQGYGNPYQQANPQQPYQQSYPQQPMPSQGVPQQQPYPQPQQAGGQLLAAVCKRCGAAVPTGSKFCLECGEKIATAESFCGSCGQSIPAGAKFCPSCGTLRG